MVSEMPVLRKQQWEVFAQSIVKGMTNDEAYVAAGFKSNPKNASRLKGREEVRRRIDELMGRNAAKLEKAADVSLAGLLAELDRAAEIAERTNDAKALVLVIQTKAKLAGMWIDRAEQTTRIVDPSTMRTRDQDAALVEFMLKGRLTEQQLAELTSGRLPLLPAPTGKQ
jgi:hypothetical protein